MVTPDIVLGLCMLSFVLGLYIGAYLVGNKWARNADRYVRVEHKGTLYHVFYADDVPDEFVMSCESKRHHA